MSEQSPSSFNYCEKCGVSTYPDAKYCHNCGTPISLSDAPTPQHVTLPTPKISRSRLGFNAQDRFRLVSQDRLRDFFPTYMVTLVSIIQTAMLGYLLLAANDQLSHVLAGTYAPIWTVLIIAMFFYIVAIWMLYARSMIMLRQIPTVVDDLVPFCLGVTQALAIFSITLQQIAWFYFAVSLSSVVVLVGYTQLWRQLRLQDNPENRLILEALGTYPRYANSLAITYFAIFLSFGVTETLLKLNLLFLAFVVLAMFVWFFFSNYLATR